LRLFLYVLLGFFLGIIATLILLSHNDIVIDSKLDIVSVANLGVVILLTLAIPILVTPYNDSQKQARSILLDEINQLLERVEKLKDDLCNLSGGKVSSEACLRTQIQFKKLRQHLSMLEIEVNRLKISKNELQKAKDDHNKFWESGTDGLIAGRSLPTNFVSENLSSAANFQMSLKELRYNIRA